MFSLNTTVKLLNKHLAGVVVVVVGGVVGGSGGGVTGCVCVSLT